MAQTEQLKFFRQEIQNLTQEKKQLLVSLEEERDQTFFAHKEKVEKVRKEMNDSLKSSLEEKAIQSQKIEKELRKELLQAEVARSLFV